MNYIIKHYGSWQIVELHQFYVYVVWWKYVEKKKPKICRQEANKCIEFICYHLINWIGQWHFLSSRWIWNHKLFSGERWSRWSIFNKGPVYSSREGNSVVILLECNLILWNLLIHHFHNIKSYIQLNFSEIILQIILPPDYFFTTC